MKQHSCRLPAWGLRRVVPVTVLIYCALGCSIVYAEAWQLRPQVSLGVGADDNWGLSPTDERQVSAWRAAGDLALSRLTERMELAGLVRLDYVTYTGDDPPEENSNQIYRFSGLFRDKGNRNVIDASATLRKDTLNRTARLAFDPGDVAVDPEADVDESVVLQQKTVTRYRFAFDAGWKSRITQRGGLGLKYRYSGVDYDNEEGTNLSEFTDQAITGNVGYKLSERNQLDFDARARLYSRPADDRRFETGEIVVRLGHKFTETISATFAVGGARTNYQTPDETGTNTGTIYRFTGKKLVGRTRYNVILGQTRNPTGAGDVVETQELRFNVSHKIGDRTNILFRTTMFQNESLLRDNPSVNRRFLSFTPSVRWQITRWWFIDAAYRYRRQKRDQDLESAESNTVLISLVYAQPRILD